MLEIGDVENKNLVHFEKKKINPPPYKQNHKAKWQNSSYWIYFSVFLAWSRGRYLWGYFVSCKSELWAAALCVCASDLQKADRVSGLSPSAVGWQMWQAVSVRGWE